MFNTKEIAQLKRWIELDLCQTVSLNGEDMREPLEKLIILIDKQKELKEMENPIQTHSEENGMNNYQTFSEAIEAAKNDPTIRKISFDLNKKFQTNLILGFMSR